MRLLAALLLPGAIALGIAHLAIELEGGLGTGAPQAVSIAWGGHVFKNQRAFDRWLRARGSSYKAWARRHTVPRAAEASRHASSHPKKATKPTREPAGKKKPQISRHPANKKHRVPPSAQTPSSTASSGETWRRAWFLPLVIPVTLGLFLVARRRRTVAAAEVFPAAPAPANALMRRRSSALDVAEGIHAMTVAAGNASRRAIVIGETSVRSCNRVRVYVIDVAARNPDVGWVVGAAFLAIAVGVLISVY